MNFSKGFLACAAAAMMLAACGSSDEPCATICESGVTSGQGGQAGAGAHGAGGGQTGSGGQAGGGGNAGGGGSSWADPTCAEVSGTAAVTFTLDEGATLAPTQQPLLPLGYTFGLVALGKPGVLVAEHKGEILRSEDAGCTWVSIGQPGPSMLTLRAAGYDRAYAFQDNDAALIRIDGTTLTKLTSPVANVLGLGADPANSDHVRLGDTGGALWESKDAGVSWVPIGAKPPVTVNLVYRYAFDPNNFDHILVGNASTGSFVSTDGGASWKQSIGLGQNFVNVFSVEISPVDGQIVWAQGIDLDHANDPVFAGQTIWRSTDGGVSFSPVVTQSQNIKMKNQVLLAPHPADAGVLYFVFGTYFQDYGTDIYRYEQATGNVTTTHNAYNDVSAIAFAPHDPKVMYFGLTADAH